MQDFDGTLFEKLPLDLTERIFIEANKMLYNDVMSELKGLTYLSTIYDHFAHEELLFDSDEDD